jgi:DNA-binding transcriptional regulator GbsR (MarR family)
VHKQIRLGDRKNYYEAEVDFWQVIKGVLREREQQEFDLALRTVNQSLERVDQAAGKTSGEAVSEDSDPELAAFYKQRMENMQRFFNTLDNIVATLLALDNLRLNSVSKLFGGKTAGNEQS